jgi:hypothetical protein
MFSEEVTLIKFNIYYWSKYYEGFFIALCVNHNNLIKNLKLNLVNFKFILNFNLD